MSYDFQLLWLNVFCNINITKKNINKPSDRSVPTPEERGKWLHLSGIQTQKQGKYSLKTTNELNT